MKTSDIVTREELRAELDLVVEAMRHEFGTVAAGIDGIAAKSDSLAARMIKVEARLATVATKQQLDEAVSNLATKQELADAVSKLTTKEELAGLEQRLGQSVAGLGKQIAALKPRKARKH